MELRVQAQELTRLRCYIRVSSLRAFVAVYRIWLDLSMYTMTIASAASGDTDGWIGPAYTDDAMYNPAQMGGQAQVRGDVQVQLGLACRSS
jgi:hypothetical protein